MKGTLLACILTAWLVLGASAARAQVSNIQFGTWYPVPGTTGSNEVVIEFSAYLENWDWGLLVTSMYWTNPVNATRSEHIDGFRVWGEPDPRHPGPKNFRLSYPGVPNTANWQISGTFLGPQNFPGILPWSFSGTGGGFHRTPAETVEILATCLTLNGEQWTKQRRFRGGSWITEERPCPNECGNCDGCPAGGVNTKLGSLQVHIGLGHTGFGKSAGQLSLQAESPSPALSTPASLQLQYAEQVETITNQSGQLRQLLTTQVLADIVTNSPYQYEIRLHARTAVGPKTDGLYPVSGPPYKTITIANPDAAPDRYHRLLITETEQDHSRLSQFLWNDPLQQWELASGNGLRHESRTSSWDPTQTLRTDLLLVQDSAGQVIRKTAETWRVFAWGTNLVQRVHDPDTSARTERYQYYDNAASDGPNYRHLRLLERPDGSWERYSYDSRGRCIKIVAPFGNATPENPETDCRVTTTEYGPVQETTSVRVLGQEIARTHRTHELGLTITQHCRSNDAPWNAATSLVTTTRWLTSGPFSNLTSQVYHPNGTLELLSYAFSADGTQRLSTNQVGAGNANAGIITNGTRTIRAVDQAGNLQSEQVFDCASGLLSAAQTVLAQDSHGRALLSATLAGTNETGYSCCGISWQRDAEGILTSYTHDPLHRVVSSTRAGVVTSNHYDVAGQLIAQFRQDVRISSNAFNLAGELIAQTDARNFTTTYELSRSPAGETIKTRRFADDSILVETWYRDGQLQSRTGTAVDPVRFEYGVETLEGLPHLFTKRIRLHRDNTDSPEWTKTYTDMLGQTVRILQADGSDHRRFFNQKGQLWKERDPDGVVTLYAYDDRGQLVTTASDQDRNDQIDSAGLDRILTTETRILSRDNTTVEQVSTWTQATANSDQATILEQTVTSVDGRQRWQIRVGQTNYTILAIDRPAARKTITQILPDGRQFIDSYQEGRLQQQSQLDNAGQSLSSISFQYDAFGRLHGSEDPFAGAVLCTYNEADQLSSVIQAGQTNRWDYDSRGRILTNHLADAAVVISEYHPSGRLKRQHGARTFPTEYAYDHAGRLLALTTWQDRAAERGRATTTWSYHPQTGQLASKTYPDQSVVSFQYTPAGRLYSRRWARGITTTYSHNTLGELTGIAYSDATPHLSFSSDRLGRPQLVTQISGTATQQVVVYAHNAAGQLLAKSHTAGPLAGLVLSNAYDSLARRCTVSVQVQAPDILHQIGFGYDAASRLATVADGTRTATYHYWPNAPHLLHQTLFLDGGTNRLITTRSYDALYRLTETRTQDEALRILDSHSYTHNAANQRIRTTDRDGLSWVYGYDALGQLTNAVRRWPGGTPIAGQQYQYQFDQIGNRQTATVGSSPAAPAAVYTPNLLNQYTARSVPGVVWQTGSAASNAVVTLNNNPVQRQGVYYAGSLLLPNTSQAVFTQLVTVGVLPNSAPNGLDVVTSLTGQVYLAHSPETFLHDPDGNLLQDGRWNYTWDAENRLVNIETAALAVAAGAPRLRLEFTYDHESRRIARKLYTWNPQSSVFTLQSAVCFVYDGWNLLAELESTPSAPTPILRRTYTWGLDLSSSEHGAGGVGGLLWMTQDPGLGTGDSHVYCFDGNGNVTALLALANQQASARYEYGPFGEPVRATGPLARGNPFRFSCHYLDDQTGLLYAQLRHYNPSTGRWLSRDPIEEQGGPSLHAYAANDPVNLFDPDGAEPRLADLPKDFAHGLLTIVRSAAGVPVSFLSGDMFDDNRITEDFPPNKCKILITINGIWNNQRQAEYIRNKASEFPRYRGSYAVAVRNGTHARVGDLVQIVGAEIGAIDVVAYRAARQIEAAKAALKRNGCPCGCIYVLAHSQGTMVFNRALPLLSKETLPLISYTGIGPQKAVQDGWGLNSRQNFANTEDFVPTLGNYNPLRVTDLRQMVRGLDIQPAVARPRPASHAFDDYAPFVKALPDNCTPKPIE